ADPRGDRRVSRGQSLPLHRLLDDHRGGRARGAPDGGGGGPLMSTLSHRPASTEPLGAAQGNGAQGLVGLSAPRVDARAKATGEAKYAGDLQIPGLAYGKVLRSPYAHARIVRIDASRAQALPGVIAVLTGDDVL